MKRKITFLTFIIFLSLNFVSAQTVYRQPPNQPGQALPDGLPIENISKDLSRITKSVEALTQKLNTFFDTFSTNQGLMLTEKQQRLLMAFEVLNRSEQRLVNLQKLKLELSEKQTTFRLQLARINDDSLPESIDRYVSTRGTTNAEQIRDIRRQALLKEKFEITTLLNDMSRDLENINHEIRQMENLLRTIRQRLFPEIEKEISFL
jgi:hypothetical protein